MNFQRDLPLEPIKVLIVNAISSCAKHLAIKILSGEIFGKNQFIDMILVVQSYQMFKANGFKYELTKCAFPCTSSIEATSYLPSFSDADVFCIVTNFPNPNLLDFDDDDFDDNMLDWIVNIANNLYGPEPQEQITETVQKPPKSGKKYKLPEKKIPKPIFVADGLVTIDILMSFSKRLPSNIFFCCTPIPVIAKSVLAGHLKVKCNVLSDVLVWAANDKIFHVEFEKPLIACDGKEDSSNGDCIMRDKHNKFASIKKDIDRTLFNASWLKKDLITKTYDQAQNYTYGYISKAAALGKTLQTIWTSRRNNESVHTNMGVISDGSLETIKGHPYVLPVVFTGETWTVDTRFEEQTHLKQEIKRMNLAAKKYHQKLIPFCKKYLHASCTPSLDFSCEGDKI